MVWDLKTGKILRAWDDGLSVEVAFAPDRLVLAIVEREQEIPARGFAGGGGGAAPGGGGRGGFGGGGFGQPGGGGRGGAVPGGEAPATPTITYKSTIGFWDLSPLVK